MNRFRTTFALAALLPVILRAADAPPAGDRPFESVRQDLGAIKSANPGIIPGPGLDLGAAAGLGGSGNFAAPPAVLAPPRQSESAAATSQPKSSGWLLDALEENSRRAGTGGGLSVSRNDPADAEEKEAGSKSGDASQPAARKTTSTLPSAVNSPLSGYMAAWLGPDEFRRLGNLYPELTGGGPQKDSLADSSDVRQRDGATPPTSGRTPPEAVPIAPGVPGTLRPADNPFVQAMQARPRSLTPVTPVGAPRPVPAPISSLTPPVPEPARPVATAPETPGADDRRYFPQLKRF